jgi:nucleoside-diphosphate-sugar epimerase
MFRQANGPAYRLLLFRIGLVMAKLIFGCGYLGRRAARLWRDAGSRVLAVTRSPSKAAELATEGIEPLVGDIAGGNPFAVPPDISTVLFAVGFDRLPANQSPRRASIREVYVGGLARALAVLPASVKRVMYISSTGVYGNFGGDEVDEDSPCQPTREGGQACLAAENLLRESRFSELAIVLRLAGIYGPGRVPRAENLRAGKPIDAPASGWLNLIHVDDAARIVLLADERGRPPRTYVVSDGHPVERRAYYEELARLLRAPPPQFVAPAADSPAAQRSASDKRVNPRRLFTELAPALVYPNYRQGLQAALASP